MAPANGLVLPMIDQDLPTTGQGLLTIAQGLPMTGQGLPMIDQVRLTHLSNRRLPPIPPDDAVFALDKAGAGTEKLSAGDQAR